jgi:hypothetical protein
MCKDRTPPAAARAALGPFKNKMLAMIAAMGT